MTRRRLLAGALAVLALVAAWYFFPTKERQVRRQLARLAAWASKDGPEGQLSAAVRARDAGRFFAPSCRWRTGEGELQGSLSPEDIGRYVFAYRSRVLRLSVKFYDVQVDFPGPSEADVTATVLLTGILQGGDEINETHEVRCTLDKGDDGWRVSRVTVVQVLKR